MTRLVRVVMVVVVIAALGGLGWRSVRGAFLNERADLEQRIVSLTGDVDRYRSAATEHTRIQDELRGYVDRTLGGDLEAVDHQLRSRLNRIGEMLGLEGLSVGTGRTRQLVSPARSQFSRRRPELRDELDFVEVDAWISGLGDFDQVLRLVAAVAAEPWLKRIRQVRLQPKDNGERFAVTVRLVTLFLPGRAPAPGRPDVMPVNLRGYEPLAARNPFHLPPPDLPPAQEAVAMARPSFPFGKWYLTGVASGPGDIEVWLLNRESGESRCLAVGENLADMILTDARGETAEFQLADQRFTVLIGQPLTARAPVSE